MCGLLLLLHWNIGQHSCFTRLPCSLETLSTFTNESMKIIVPFVVQTAQNTSVECTKKLDNVFFVLYGMTVKITNQTYYKRPLYIMYNVLQNELKVKLQLFSYLFNIMFCACLLIMHPLQLNLILIRPAFNIDYRVSSYTLQLIHFLIIKNY